MRRAARAFLPSYEELFGRRYPVADVVQANGRVLDLAWLEMCWRHSAILGQEASPFGLHTWPPPWEEAAVALAPAAEVPALSDAAAPSAATAAVPGGGGASSSDPGTAAAFASSA